MKYISTRGGIEPVSFTEAVMMGLADDGGLLLPESIPQLTDETLDALGGLNYQDLAFQIIALFADDIPGSDLKLLIDKSYQTFTNSEITPIIKKGDLYIMELFHGPTLAFKDVALQLLGNLFEYLLEKQNTTMNILGATSGDTGSAAIYGVRGKERIHIFIIHPHQRVSPVQELQMTTVLDRNVHNIALLGTFDDGQAIVKTVFNNIEFKKQYHLGAVNSINWARILAQVVYYIYAYLRIADAEKVSQVDFSVPTGNFGDIFAGYIARAMLPGKIRKLVLATNANDLLARFVEHGDYSIGKVVPTSSPSMDIQVASNFERFLYYLQNEDPQATRTTMEQFSRTGTMTFNQGQQQIVRQIFSACSVDEPATRETIASFFKKNGYILDPHTAVGIHAGLAYKQPGIPMICLSTAHPAKFGSAVEEAIGQEIELPVQLAALDKMETRCSILAADAELIKQYICDHV